MATKPPKEKIRGIIDALKKGIVEKDEVIAVSLLGALAGQNVFLLGPPGTAKSLISRRLASVFETKPGTYFEYLMQKFSTPEEVFGPVSLKELKKDNYKRITEGYLPEAEFAFLDEIWKSSPAILNTLLTLINEKKFRNGDEMKDVPLKALISASNEVPPKGQGLEALYDRFLVRLMVSPTQRRENFEDVVKNAPPRQEVQTDKITENELQQWQTEIANIKLSSETLNIVHGIRIKIKEFNQENEKSKIDISDRRWQRACHLLKAAAFFNDRTETSLTDTLLLRHCLWSQSAHRKDAMEIVDKVVEENGFETGISFYELEKEQDRLGKEMEEKLYHKEDGYVKEVKQDGKEYIKVVLKHIAFPRTMDHSRRENPIKEEFYVPVSRMGTDGEFHPKDGNLHSLHKIVCNFGGTNSFSVAVRGAYIYLEHLAEGKKKCKSARFGPHFSKGSVRKDISWPQFSSLVRRVVKLADDIGSGINEIREKQKIFELEQNSLFVPKDSRAIVTRGLDSQLAEFSAMRVSVKNMSKKLNEARKALSSSESVRVSSRKAGKESVKSQLLDLAVMAGAEILKNAMDNSKND